MNIKKLNQSKIIKHFKYIKEKLDEHDIYAFSGYVSYKMIISLIPLAVVLAVFLSGTPTIENWLFESLEPITAPQAYAFVKYISVLARENATAPILSVSMAITLYTASSGVYTLMKGISVVTDGNGSFEKRGVIKNRAIAVCITATAYILILCCGFIAMEMKRYNMFYSIKARQIASYFLLVLSVLILLCFIYKTAPTQKTGWSDALRQALFSCIMIMVLIFGINIYYTRISDISNVYGALAGLAVIMVGIYGMAFCVILSAEKL